MEHDVDKLIFRRSILDWRDKHVSRIEERLTSELKELFGDIDHELSKAALRDLILHPGKFGKKQIEPLYSAWLKQALESTAEDANRDLADIIDHSLLFETNDDSLEHDHSSGRYSELAILATTGTAGIAAIPTVITVSTVSAGGILGVIGVTAISWPIALAGIAVTGALFAVSGHQTAKLKTKAIERYKKKIHEVIRNKVLGKEYLDDSICRHLQAQVIDTASNILAEIDHAHLNSLQDPN